MVSAEQLRPGRPSAAFLDFDGGNNWETVKPFFEVPAWWRRFIFVLLTPREYTVYCYIVSYCGAAKLARPLIRQMQADLNIANSVAIHNAIRRLIELGFLLKEQKTLLTRQRNIYKRPSLEHTLLTLLEKKLIDGNLVALERKKNAVRNEKERSSESISTGLRLLLGSDLHAQWRVASNKSKASVLYRLLSQRLTEKRAEHAASQVAEAAQKSAVAPADKAATAKAASALASELFSVNEIFKELFVHKPSSAAAVAADAESAEEAGKDDSAEDEVPF